MPKNVPPDLTIELTGFYPSQYYSERLRLVRCWDEEQEREFVFLTNAMHISALQVAELYNNRWQVELFFKWLKQHLKIKKFWGTTENAVRIRIHVAICTCCLVAIVQKDMQLDGSTYEVLQILSISLTDKTYLRDLFERTKFQNVKDRLLTYKNTMMMKTIGINYRFRVLLLLLICTPLFLFSQNMNNRNMGKLEPFYIVVDTTKVHASPVNSRNLLKSELGIKDAIDIKNYYQKGLKVKDLTKDKIGYTHHRFSQYYEGIRIEYTDIRVRYKNNKMVSANGWYLKTIDVDVNPVISFETAVAKAIEYINAKEYIWESEEENEWLRKTTNRADTSFYPQPELVICHNYLSVEDTALYLAYKLNIYAIEPLCRDYVYVSALTGDVINIEPIIKKVLGTAHTRYSGTRTIATQLHNSTYRLRDYDSDRG